MTTPQIEGTVIHALLLGKGASGIEVLNFDNYRTKVAQVVRDEVIPIGRARVDRAGSDLTIITYGIGVHVAREATGHLAGDGIDVEVIDLRTLAPMDREAVARSVQKTGRLLVLHEANRTMGFGAEVAAFAAEELFSDLDAPVVRVAADDCHLPYNGAEETAILPDASDVVTAARRLLAY